MNIGEKLKELRIQRNLTQEELADRCELSKGFISQVERDLASPSIATLTDMLECLGSSLKEFFSDDSAEKVVYAPQDMFEKEEEDKKITWLVPDAQRNSMEPILLELQPGARSNELPPLESEEFGYVLQGSVSIHRGAKPGKSGGGQTHLPGAEGLQLLPAPQHDPLSGKHRRSPRRHSLDLYSAKLLSLSLLKELYRHDGTGTPH